MPARRILLAFLHTGLLLAAGCAPSPEKLMADAEKAFASGETPTAEIHLKNLP